MELHEITSKNDRIAAELRKLEDRKEDLLIAERVWRELEGTAPIAEEVQAARPGITPDFDLEANYQERVAKAFFGVSFDLSNARNNLERVVIIVEATGQDIHPMTLAGYFLAAGISRSPIPNNRSHIYNDLKDAEAEFEYIKKEGTFRYKRLTEVPAGAGPDSYESDMKLDVESPSSVVAEAV